MASLSKDSKISSFSIDSEKGRKLHSIRKSKHESIIKIAPQKLEEIKDIESSSNSITDEKTTKSKIIFVDDQACNLVMI